MSLLKTIAKLVLLVDLGHGLQFGSNQEIKLKIEQLAKGTQNGLSATAETIDEICALCQGLDSPVKDPASSADLNGRWELLFTTTKGSSGGKLGPFVGKVYQEIELEESRYVNFLNLPGIEARLDATWKTLAPDQWQVLFRSIQFNVFGFSLPQKELKAKGIWRMSYLDDTFRILYAQGNSNDENIYILRRVI